MLAAVYNAVIYDDSKILHWLASRMGVSDTPLTRDEFQLIRDWNSNGKSGSRSGPVSSCSYAVSCPAISL